MFQVLCVIATSALGYLIGSLSPSLYLAERRSIDLRSTGTNNPGTMNVAYSLGVVHAALVLVLDIAKTVIPYWIARALNPTLDWAGPLAGALAMVGHIFPCWHGFKGGRGLACFVGLGLSVFPLYFCLAILATALIAAFASNGGRWAILLGCGMAGLGIPLFIQGVASMLILTAATALVFGQNIAVAKGLTPGSHITARDVFRRKE